VSFLIEGDNITPMEVDMAKVVIVGGGFGGLNVAKGLKNTNHEVLIIDKSNHHLFQPLLYQVATAAISPGEIACPVRELFSGSRNITCLMGEVVEFQPKNHSLLLGNGEKIDFDYLVVAIGARHSYFGHAEWEKYAPGLKTLSDALKIRENILIAFEEAERAAPYESLQPFLTFVVIGGGPTGVEMSGAIAEIAKTSLVKNFRRFDPAEAKIILVEAAPYILPVYPEKLSIRAKKDLEDLGVTVWTSRKVTAIDEKGVYVDGELVETRNIIWAAGNEAPAVLSTLGAAQDKARRVLVESDLTIKHHPNIFVIGDCSSCLNHNGKPLPGIAPTAIQQGRYVAKIINSQAKTRPPFLYFDKGTMATIGKAKAVAVAGKLNFAGFMAWLAWCFIHLVYLNGFKNRLVVILRWAGIFLTGQRGIRLIYREIDKILKSRRH